MVEDKSDITNYYTIAGNWMQDREFPTICGLCLYYGGNCFMVGPDERLVLDSHNSSPNYIPTNPHFPYDHFELLNPKDVYEMRSPMLKP